MRNTILDKSVTHTAITSATSGIVSLDGCNTFLFQANVDVNTPSAVKFLDGNVETTTFTFQDKATSTAGDYCVVYDTAGLGWGVALSKEAAEVTSINFADKASTTGGDYFVVYDTAGLAWAAALNVAGTDPAPTGAIYAAIPAARKVNVNISATTNDEDIAAAVKAAMDLLVGFTSVFTITNPADGTLTFTVTLAGACTDAVVKNADDSGAGSIAKTVSTQGVSRVVPTGAIWASLASARKGYAIITADTTAANVAARVEVAFDALTDVPFATADPAANGTLVCTMTLRGVCTAATVKNADDSGAGGITKNRDVTGVASAINITDDTITIASHALYTGLKIQLTIDGGTLPTGVTTGTDYFVIVVDVNTIKLASTLAYAQAGTAINITSQGTAGQEATVTAVSLAGASLTLAYSANDASLLAGVWKDVASATSITADAVIAITATDIGYKYLRYSYAITAGSMTVSNYIVGGA